MNYPSIYTVKILFFFIHILVYSIESIPYRHFVSCVIHRFCCPSTFYSPFVFTIQRRRRISFVSLLLLLTRLFICILQYLLRPYIYQIDNPCLGHNNHLYGLYIIRRIENRRTVLDISCVSKVRQHLSLIINNNNI